MDGEMGTSSNISMEQAGTRSRDILGFLVDTGKCAVGLSKACCEGIKHDWRCLDQRTVSCCGAN